MRPFFAAALAAFGLAAPALADERYTFMSADEVTRAIRCAPPKVCRAVPRPQRRPATGGYALASRAGSSRRPSAASAPRGGAWVASYYAHAHHGRRAASGERFDMHAATCAHRTASFGTVFRVTYRGRSATCRVNDRGPYVGGRALDVSLGVARAIGLTAAGVGQVSIERIN